MVAEHLLRDGGSKYLYMIRKPSGIGFLAFLDRLTKKIGKVSFAGIKDTSATAYFYVSSDQKISNPSRIMWFIGKTKELSPASNAGNSFRISIEINEPKGCKGYLDLIKQRLCESRPTYFANFYGYQRFGFSRPTNHIIGKDLKNKNLFSIWLYVRSKYSKSLPLIERNILKRGIDRLNINPSIPSDLKGIILESYTSYIFNRVVSRLVDVTKPIIFESDYAFLESMFRGGKIYCGSSVTNAFFARIGIIGETIDSVVFEEVVKPRANVFKRRPVFAPVCNYTCSRNGDIFDLSFTLPSGSYATVLLGVLGILAV